MSDPEVPENFNALYSRGAKLARGLALAPVVVEHAAAARLARDVADLALDIDEVTQNPNRLSVQQPRGRLSERVESSPDTAALGFVADRADLWNLSDEDMTTVEIVSVSRRGLPTVRLIQKVEGVEVFQSEMTAAVGADNRVISLSGQLFAEAAGAPARAAARGEAETPAEVAIARAATDLTGRDYDSETVHLQSDAEGGYRFYEATAPEGAPAFERLVRVKDVLFPLGVGQFAPGYFIELWLKGYPAFSYVIDSVGLPEVLFRKNLTSGLKFKYWVHNTGDSVLRPEDGPAPGTPHPTGSPDDFQAETIAERMIEVESLLPGRPWLPDGATTTRGNNCIAYADLRDPNGFGAGDVAGAVTAPLTFGARYDHSKGADDPTNLQNSLVGMFFHVNWLHDRWYEAGFDEASGNAQQDNFGLGGLAGDPILAEGNDLSGTDNANMSTPPDGSSPRMQMFLFKGPAPLPSRTSNHEALITFHEMGHYITNRLIGNGSGLANIQGRSMGEGWGDFFAICMTSQAADDFANGVFAAGGWTDIQSDFKDNYYFSIRRYPYSADMTKSPLTFRHIGANVLLPAGPPRNPTEGGNNAVHNAGEVWCCALWEVFVNLVAAHGHAVAESRMLEYVVGGLKITPSNPTFLQARDAFLAAVAGLNPGDTPLAWQGFAKRGMGRGAVGPAASSSSLTGVTESFVVP
jgi:extracellular elastinolytic metalloproteinase